MEQLFFYLMGFIMGTVFMALVNSINDEEGGEWE